MGTLIVKSSRTNRLQVGERTGRLHHVEIHEDVVQALAGESGICKITHLYAKAAVGAAKAFSPKRLGHYDRSLFTTKATRATRGVSIVGSDDFKAWWVEYGTRRGAPKKIAPLRQAVRVLGLRVVEDRGP